MNVRTNELMKERRKRWRIHAWRFWLQVSNAKLCKPLLPKCHHYLWSVVPVLKQTRRFSLALIQLFAVGSVVLPFSVTQLVWLNISLINRYVLLGIECMLPVCRKCCIIRDMIPHPWWWQCAVANRVVARHLAHNFAYERRKSQTTAFAWVCRNASSGVNCTSTVLRLLVRLLVYEIRVLRKVIMLSRRVLLR
jgi:hypothetical protein